jgi:hypothetical protein
MCNAVAPWGNVTGLLVQDHLARNVREGPGV